MLRINRHALLWHFFRPNCCAIAAFCFAIGEPGTRASQGGHISTPTSQTTHPLPKKPAATQSSVPRKAHIVGQRYDRQGTAALTRMISTTRRADAPLFLQARSPAAFLTSFDPAPVSAEARASGESHAVTVMVLVLRARKVCGPGKSGMWQVDCNPQGRVSRPKSAGTSGVVVVTDQQQMTSWNSVTVTILKTNNRELCTSA